LKLENGSASNGGAIYLNDSYSGATLVLDHVVASGNTASTYGGVIYASDYGAVYINASKFSHNHAAYGGAMYQYWSDVNITSSKFTHNGSPAGVYGEGGAFYNEYGVFDMTGGSISDNTVGDATQGGEGGGIYDEYGMETLTNVHLDGNVAGSSVQDGYGGAFYGYENVLEINHGTMSHNHALGSYGSGGGIYVYYQNQVALHGVTMAGNKASGSSDSYGGGTVYAYGESYPTQLVIDQHSKITGSNNSAVYLEAYNGSVDASITNSTLANNTDNSNNGFSSYGCGGAVCAYAYQYGGLNLEMQGDKVTGNSSVGDNGAGAVTAYSYYYAGLSTVLRHNTFADNLTGAGGWGGAVGFYSDDDTSPISVRMASNSFTGNRAGTQSDAGWGGALSAYYDTVISDTGSTFSGNRAIGDSAYGGAVSDYTYYGSSSWTRTKFTHNSAGTNQAANYGYGGAFYSDNYAGDIFNQVTMSGNESAGYGGGFYSDSSAYMALFRGSTVSGNTAGTSAHEGYGGGIYGGDQVLTVENSTLTGNKVTSHGATLGQGGAIWYSGSRMGLRYSTVSGNYGKQGAGIYSDAYGGSLLSSIVSGNRVSKTGSEQDCAVGAPESKPNSLGGNVLGKGSCVLALASGDKVAKNPGLKSLANNGGPTKTMALTAKSLAIGRAMFQIPSTDQRGHGRPSKHADAGAFELPKVT
jgi:hypothetical protein